jgi:hypothetical protein
MRKVERQAEAAADLEHAAGARRRAAKHRLDHHVQAGALLEIEAPPFIVHLQGR